ncbi:MAG: hypothetical protein AMXMBFR82_37580 [Candidatus Hydrogenedentota bacterium]
MSAEGGGGGPVSPPAEDWAGAFGSVFFARILSTGATFVTVILAARMLGRGAYGELIVLLSIMKVAAELVGPALDTTLVRFAARHSGDSTNRSFDYVRTVFRLKLILAGALLVLGCALAWPLDRLLSDPAAGIQVGPAAVILAFAGAASTVLWAFAQASLQARQQFARYAAVELVCSLVRLFLVATLLGAGVHRVMPVLGAYVAAPTVAALIAWRGVPKGLFARGESGHSVLREIAGFAKWVLLACAFTSLAQRADIFLLTGFQLPSESIGDYGAALQLTLIGDLVILTLFNVLLPKASTLKSSEELRAFLHQFRVPALLMFVALLPFLLVSRWIAVLAFGPEYIRAGGLFAVLVLGSAFALGCAPAGAALYGMGRTSLIALLEGLKLIAIVLGGLVFIDTYGLFGMAWAVAATKGVIGVITYAVALYATRQDRFEHDH